MAYRRPLQDLIDNAGAAEGADTGLTEYDPRNGGSGGGARGSLQPGMFITYFSLYSVYIQCEGESLN